MNKDRSESPNDPTIGLLSPGEMGSCLARILTKQGYRVVTTLDGRSDRTRRQAAECSLVLVESMEDLAREASVVISVVPPADAERVAAEFQAAVQGQSAGVVYVDANAIAPATAQRIDRSCQNHGVDFVDASIHGLAAKLPTCGTLYLSGKRANQIATLFESSLCVTILGADPGTASAAKMLIGGLNKGVVALFTELTLLADSLGLLNETLEIYERSYPGVMEIVARLLPTFPRHAQRRRQELHELSRTMRDAGFIPNMARGAEATLSLFVQATHSDSGVVETPLNDQRTTIIDLVHRLSSSRTGRDQLPIQLPTLLGSQLGERFDGQ